MTDPKTLQDIADKACIFDVSHFDDDTPPTSDTLVSNHERLSFDRKLITRLRPRYAVALGFFEGYAKAVEDNETVRIEHRREIEIMEKDREESERSLAEHAKQLEAEIATLVKERDDKTTEWMAAQTALDNEKTAHRQTSTELGAIKDAARYVAHNVLLHGSVPGVDRWKDILESTRRMVDAVDRNDPKNIGIVKRPPPPPPPAAPIADPYPWTGKVYGFDCYVDRAGFVQIWNGEKLVEPSDSVESGARRLAIVELVARFDAYDKTLIEPMREALAQSEAERSAMKEERDRALARVRSWEARTRETEPRIVQAKLEKDKPIANDELSTDVDDELAQAAADHANDFKGKSSLPRDCQLVRIAVGMEDDACSHWDDRVAGFVEGARWQLNRMENVAGEDPPNVHELREENGQLLRKIEWYEAQFRTIFGLTADCKIQGAVYAKDGDPTSTYRDGCSDPIAVVRQSNESKRDRSLAPTPIVFRDNDERSYWDSMTLVLARKGDTTSQSVASAADELVEERRARMDIRIVSETAVRTAIIGFPKKEEPSDELLLKAATYANAILEKSQGSDEREIECARAAFDDRQCLARWDLVARAYIDSALAK